MQTFPRNVLVVEDDVDIRELITLILNLDGHQVVSVATGYDALTYLSCTSELPQVVLLDLDLGDMTGDEVVMALRQRADWSAIPVVLVSASPHLGTIARAVGVATWVQKPFDPFTLQAVVNQHVRPQCTDVSAGIARSVGA